jgi:hypothetical protein
VRGAAPVVALPGEEHARRVYPNPRAMRGRVALAEIEHCSTATE